MINIYQYPANQNNGNVKFAYFGLLVKLRIFSGGLPTTLSFIFDDLLPHRLFTFSSQISLLIVYELILFWMTKLFPQFFICLSVLFVFEAMKDFWLENKRSIFPKPGSGLADSLPQQHTVLFFFFNQFFGGIIDK